MEKYDELLKAVTSLSKELHFIKEAQASSRKDTMDFKNNIFERLHKIEYSLFNEYLNRINKAEELLARAEHMIGRLEDRISFLQSSLVQSCLNQSEEKLESQGIVGTINPNVTVVCPDYEEVIKPYKDKLELVKNVLNQNIPDARFPEYCVISHYKAIREIVNSIIDR